MKASIYLSLPETLNEFINEQVKICGYKTASDYVQDVLKQEQENRVRSAIENRLKEALATPLHALTSQDWIDVRNTGINPLAK